MKNDLVKRFTYIPPEPEEFTADKFIRYWYFSLKSSQVEVAEELISYPSLLPANAEPEDWKSELTIISQILERYPPTEIHEIRFTERFESDVWIRFCTLKMRVTNVAMIGYLRNNGLFLWNNHFEKTGDYYELEVTYCVRMEDIEQ